MTSAPLIAAAATVLAATTPCQSWVQLQPNTVPPARAMGDMVAALSQGTLVMFGGEAFNPGGQTFGDTWTWDGTDWTLQTPATSPPALEGGSLAYDLLRDRVVMFSGWNGGQYVQQTWEWDGTTWAQLAPATSPPGRDWFAAEYDLIRGNTVIFGGHDFQITGGRLNDTWTWDGTNWTQQTPTTSPSPRWGHAMAFDPATGTTIMFGGADAGGAGDETWSWDGANWTQLSPTTVPPPRQWHELVFDQVSNRVLMIGGTWSSVPLQDVWEWNGTDWTQLTVAGGPPRGDYLAMAAFDQNTGNVVQFGGSDVPSRGGSTDETWALAPAGSNFATVRSYGNGCGGVENYASLYEEFGTFDLAGTAGAEVVLQFINTGPGYLVVPGAPAWFTPTSPDLALADDDVSPPQAMGFTFPYPGGSTTDLHICSNGFIWLQQNSSDDYSPSVGELLSNPERFCPVWADLQPGSGGGAGTIHFDVDPSGTVVYVTWLGCQRFNSPGSVCDVQAAFFVNGNAELRYRGNTLGGPQLVGWSPGNGAADPGASDLSTGGPFLTLPDQSIPNIRLSSTRPIEGATLAVTVDNLPAATTFAALAMSPTQVLPGVQPIPGLDTCVQLVGTFDAYFFPASGASRQLNFTVPVGTFTGAAIYAQAIVLAPGVTPSRVATSNGLEWVINTN